MSKNITEYIFVLVFKIVVSLQCILKQVIGKTKLLTAIFALIK